MAILGRWGGLAVFACLSLCSAITGCAQFDHNLYAPMEPPTSAYCPTCARQAAMFSNGNDTPGAPASPEVVQTIYRPLKARTATFPSSDPPPMDGPPPAPTIFPRELTPTSHPPYTVAPPDVLLIDAIRMVPKGPYRLEPLEMVQVNVTETLPGQPITGAYMITPEGTISLGFSYGSVHVGGLTLELAEQAIRKHLAGSLKNPTVTLAVVQFRGIQQIRGEHLVRPDGTISLGSYGSVYVAGFTLGQIKCEVEKYLSAYLVNPQLSIDVLSYNSKRYYVIFDGGGYGMQVFPLPITGNEYVLDAVARVGGLAPVSSTHKIVLARPSPLEMGCNQVLPVDLKAIMHGSVATNYQIFPGDRLYVYPDPFIQIDNYLAKLLAPVERILGITLLGTSTVQSFQNFNNGTGNGGAFFVAPR